MFFRRICRGNASASKLIILLLVLQVAFICGLVCDSISYDGRSCGWIYRKSFIQIRPYRRSNNNDNSNFFSERQQSTIGSFRINSTKKRRIGSSSIFSQDKLTTDLDIKDDDNDGTDSDTITQSNIVRHQSFFSNIRSLLSENLALAILIVIVFSVTAMSQLETPPTISILSANEMRTTIITKENVVANARWSQLPIATQLSVMMTNPFQQFETVGMIPKSYFDDHITVYGYTERIIDGDTIRVRHIPGYAMLLPTNNLEESAAKQKGRRGGIADTTLLIRLYGIDCPEISKNKNQITQPFGSEAKEYMSNTIDHQVVKISLLRKDRYGRAVAMVETIPPNILASSKDLSIELARQGYAELYTGGGFEYNVSFLLCSYVMDHTRKLILLTQFYSSLLFFYMVPV